ncbi:MAG: class I SAM-dependent methyltransferase [Candidatus Zixiibacteriota bacterium]|nr:MAG: class I SAM-dependent methyltransferase [candidate division Zixibacteria bacterium]
MHRSGYLETEEKLKIRIRAHTAYASVRLEDWLSDWLGKAYGCRLLEIGCGDGNFFPTYAQSLGHDGLITGFDINLELLHKARAVAEHIETPTIVFAWDFDVHPYPLLDEEVDILIAPFSAYYTNDVSGWVDDSLRVTKKKGRLLLLGPTRDNAHELYELNETVTGIGTVPETDETSTKLEDTFLPELQERLSGRVKTIILDRNIVFPDAESFAEYYFATWLYEKTLERLKKPVEFESVLRAAQRTSLKLSKRIVCIEARKT